MVITIGRTFGSGGRIMGKELADRLGIKFYDSELIRLVSDETGINESLFGETNERLKKSYIGQDLSWMEDPTPLPPSNKKYTSEENLFRLNAKLIRELADKEDCVIMGRCGATVLEGRKDVIRIFCYASPDDCTKRAMEVCGLSEKDAIKRINEVDRYRENYYKHFTGKKITDATSYDLCINTGTATVEELVDFVCMFIENKKNR
ncbi:MAG: cytidylate kinase-like family protein [Lachnospiraceae bacterium]|nr:cytidylate kinase-like family protein [Candidatus Colinaster scatohippi]